jgi:O-antigen ligase
MSALELRPRISMHWVLVLPAAVVLAYMVVRMPAFSAGVLLGSLLLLLVITRPLALVALMLAIGPVNLAFITGGFKSLFPQIGGLDMNGLRLMGVTAGFLLVWFADRRVHRETAGPLGRWYALFLLWAAFSLVTSIATLEGLRLLLKLAYPFFTFVIVAGLVEKEEQLDQLMAWTLGAGMLIIFLVHPLLVLAGVDPTPDFQLRIGGLGNHENPFSFYLLVLVLIAFARFMVRRQARYLVICAVAAVWILLTVCRITMFALPIGLLAIVLYSAFAHRNYRMAIGGIVVASLIALLLVRPTLQRSLGYVPSPAELVHLVSSPGSLQSSMRWEGRQVLWAIAYNAFRGDPVTGMGLGSSSMVLQESLPGIKGAAVHNEYLRLGVDVGVIGVGLYFIALLSWLVFAARAGWRGTARAYEYAMAAIAVILCWAIIAITDNPFDYYTSFTQYAGFLTAGAVLSTRLAAARAVRPQGDARG